MDKEALLNGYFEGSLSPNQLEEVERLRASDAEFATEFEFRKELQLALKKEERSQLKNMFNTIAEEESKPESILFQLRPWLAAASIALLVGLASWFFIFNTTDFNTDELYASNFAPYDNVVHPIERGNQLEDLKTNAFTAYEQGAYAEALELFKELNTKHNDSYIDFYSAMVLMQLNQHQEAIPLLEKYIERDGELKDRATWYLALGYLKMEEIDKCREQLNLVVQKNTFKTANAKKLLDQLD